MTKRQEAKRREAKAQVRRKLSGPEEFLWRGKASPWVTAMKLEYEKRDLDKWDNLKVYRTCCLFHCTIMDLCALVGLFSRKTVQRLVLENSWPMYLTLQWEKLLRVRTGMVTPDTQDMAAAKNLAWKGEPIELPMPKVRNPDEPGFGNGPYEKSRNPKCVHCKIKWRRPGRPFCSSCERTLAKLIPLNYDFLRSS